MKKSALIICLMFTFKLFADVHPSVQRVREQCIFDQDWEAKQCYVVNKDDEYYQSSIPWQVVGPYSLETISGIMSVGEGLYDAARIIASGGSWVNEDARVRSTIIREVNYVRQFNTLTDCQQACLVKCAASAILDYELSSSTRYTHVENSYDEGVGVCTEFSRVARDIGRSLGISVGLSYGPQHVFNNFTINGRRYLAEPQNGRCEFFTRRTLSDQQISRYDVDINGGPRHQGLYSRTRTASTSSPDSDGSIQE